METNSTTMGRSLKSAADVLDCLRTTRWDLFTAVAEIQGERAGHAAKLLQEVVTWLKTDEHGLAAGLASKLSDAEGRAIKLLKPIPPPPPPPPGPEPWSVIGSGKKDRLSAQEWSTTSQELLQRLETNPRSRLTVQWTLEEEPQ
jgi:hypothetical protein